MILLALEKDEDGDITFSFSQRHGSWYGKPLFPESTKSYEISDYIGPDSIGFFITLGLDLDFLEESVDMWENSGSYKAAKSAVDSIPVINDASERGVKITSDFLESAKKEERFQTILQVAENDRKRVPNQRKPRINLLKLNN